MQTHVHSHSLSLWRGRLKHSVGLQLAVALRLAVGQSSPSLVRHAIGFLWGSWVLLGD
jgi:hypothetical protein